MKQVPDPEADSPLSEERIGPLVIAAELRGITPLVRVPMNTPEIILKHMDVGAMGVIIPGMNSPEAAQRAVSGVKYPPLGKRGLAGVRAADYGLSGPLGDYVKVANEETMVLGMLEDKQGVENINAILETEGLDGLIIGPSDLSKSLGIPGQTRHPRILEVMDRVLEAGRKKNKPIGGVVRMDEDPQDYIKKGFRIIQTSMTGLLAYAAKEFLKKTNGS